MIYTRKKKPKEESLVLKYMREKREEEYEKFKAEEKGFRKLEKDGNKT